MTLDPVPRQFTLQDQPISEGGIRLLHGWSTLDDGEIVDVVEMTPEVRAAIEHLWQEKRT